MKPLLNPFRRASPASRHQQVGDVPDAYWSLPAEQLRSALHSGADGLSSAEAAQRPDQYGPNSIRFCRCAWAERFRRSPGGAE